MEASAVIHTTGGCLQITEWISLFGKTLEEVISFIDSKGEAAVIEDAEGFGDYPNMEDEPIETIMEAVEAIEEFGVEDYYRTGI